MQRSSTYPPTLGIDFGTRRVGLAVSRGSLASPLVVLINDQQIWTRLAQIVADHQIKQVVIGLSEQASAERAKDWGSDFATRFGLPIFYSDETLSTHEARERLSQAGHYVEPGDHVDHFAAAIILENWLDLNAN